jgi:putative MATE family efflux protein
MLRSSRTSDADQRDPPIGAKTMTRPATHPGGAGHAALTEGPILRTLVLFSLPILASSVLQSLNGSINAVWIGRLIGPAGLSAGANANSLLFFLLAAGLGLGIAASILVAQGLGARNMEMAKRTVGTTLSFFVIVSVVIGAVGMVETPAMLRAMGTPPEALPLASAYLKIIFLALPGLYLFTFAMMALRGAGDARTPFVFMLIAAILDVGLNPLLIRGFGPVPALGIAGSAWATLIGQWAGLLGLIGWMYRAKHFLRLRRDELHYLKLDGAILRALITKGVPMGLQMIVMSSSMILMISMVNNYGALTVAAYGACFQLWSYIQMPSFALSSAVSSMAAQNVGAGRWDRVARIAQSGVLFSCLMTGALVLIVTLVDRAAFGLFLGDEGGAVDIARHIHSIASWSFILFGVSMVLSGVVRATGAVIPPLIILVLAMWGVRVPFAWLLMPHLGQNAIWLSFPVGSLIAMLLSIAYYRFGDWRQARMIEVPHRGLPEDASVEPRQAAAAS